MFKRAKRKLATATHKVARRARVYAAVRRPTDSSSDGEPLPDPWKWILPKERESSPRPGIRSKRKAGIKDLAKQENVSHPKLDNDDHSIPGAAIRPVLGPKDKESDNLRGRVEALSYSCQQEAEDPSIGNGDMKFITVNGPNQQLQALLLPPFTYQRTRALVHARHDLRAVESELATTATEMDHLIRAQSELEQQGYREVPGTFLDDDAYAYADRGRRQLLMATIKKKIRFCELTLGDLEGQRSRLEAEFEALQEQFFDDLERAARDDSVARASVSKHGNPRNAAVWWTR